MESQVDPSFQLATTCESVWPGLKCHNHYVKVQLQMIDWPLKKKKKRSLLNVEDQYGGANFWEEAVPCQIPDTAYILKEDLSF